MNFKRTHNHDLPLPQQQTTGSAGYDLAATDPVTLKPGERKLIPTGWACEIPFGMAGIIKDRSGLAYKHGLTVMAGVIDSDYVGEVQVLLTNLGEYPVTIEQGERMAQMVVVPCLMSPSMEVKGLQDTLRGSGGFGHTGK